MFNAKDKTKCAVVSVIAGEQDRAEYDREQRVLPEDFRVWRR